MLRVTYFCVLFKIDTSNGAIISTDTKSKEKASEYGKYFHSVNLVKRPKIECYVYKEAKIVDPNQHAATDHETPDIPTAILYPKLLKKLQESTVPKYKQTP